VNGLLAQRGLVNGAMRGMTNGKVNGLTNGRVNGLLVQRGMVNGAMHGMTNGKVNGLTNGRGVINGGLVNGLGLVNGEGMVNGSGGPRRLRQRRRERIIWRYRLTAMVLFVTMVLMISMIGNLMLEEETGRIRIDGNFSDWSGVRGYYARPEDAGREMRIVETRLLRDSDRLNLFMSFAGDAFTGTGAAAHSVWAFVDLDGDDATGYSMRGMGVDLAVEAYGWNGTLAGTALLRFNPGADRNDWNGFSRTGTATAAYRDNMLELSVRMPADLMGQATEPRVLVAVLDPMGGADITDYMMTQEP